MADREVWVVEFEGAPCVVRGSLVVRPTEKEALAVCKYGPDRAVRYIPAESAKAEAQPAGTGWVSVEERLPEQREWVLLWSKSKRDGHDAADHFRVGYWDHDRDAGERAPNWCNDESWFGDVGDLDLVTHWMPLPSPPEPHE